MENNEERKTAVKVEDLMWKGQAVYRLSEKVVFSPVRSPTQYVVCVTDVQRWGPFEGGTITTVYPSDEKGVLFTHAWRFLQLTAELELAKGVSTADGVPVDAGGGTTTVDVDDSTCVFLFCHF